MDGPGGARYPDVCRVRRDPHRHRPHLPPHLLAVPGAQPTNSPVLTNTALVRAGRGLAHGFLRPGRDRSGLVRPLLLPGLQQTTGPPLYCIASSVPVLLSPSLSRVPVFTIFPDRTTPGYPSASWSIWWPPPAGRAGPGPRSPGAPCWPAPPCTPSGSPTPAPLSATTSSSSTSPSSSGRRSASPSSM